MEAQIVHKAANEKYINQAHIKEINENYSRIKERIEEIQGDTANSLDKRHGELWLVLDEQLKEFKNKIKIQTQRENAGKRDWDDVEKELEEKLETLTDIAQKIDVDNIRLA